MKKIRFIIAISFLLFGTLAQAINLKENLLFTARMEGNQVVPANNSNAKGLASFMLNKKRDSISINIGMVGLEATNVAIYAGKEGENGTLLLDLSTFLDGNKISTLIKGAQVTTNIAKWLRGDLYILVSTANNPTGEIRGQIKLEADLHFVADLNGTQAVPQVTGPAYGLGSFALSGDKSKLHFNIICQNLTGAMTGAKLHIGATGSTGAETADLATFITGNVISGSVTTDAAFLNSLSNGEIYLNITTAANPSGEVRSTLRLQKGLAFDAFATGMQMIPTVNTNGKAVCVFRIVPSMDTLFYDVVVDNINTNIDYSHLHIGFAGDEYEALQMDFSSSINGHRIKGFKKGAGALSNTTIAKLLISNLSLVVHTAAHPTGEIRGQVVRFAREGYTIKMDGAQSVPSTASNAFGMGIVSISREEQDAHYMWVAGNLSATTTGAHFHNQEAGQTGAVIYDMSSTLDATDTYASDFGYWKNTDANTPFSTMLASQIDNNKVYLNIHNANFPDGEIRGQVLKGQIFYPATSDSKDVLLENNASISISPNPTSEDVLVKIEHLPTAKINLKITDILGKTVSNKAFSHINGAFSSRLDLTDLNSGVYIVTVEDGINTYSTRVVKN
jgi:hypothetical protein